ncbi:sulfatase-like hydrolase/transferase [Sphaerisporangium sp. TRM90804]|uniref:sulfatase-like hydrolase/transferase n=1 Tax=Sphaerisporangium sp. TRM90804 TaxID=3031113 RepID=UPI00244B2BC1|nr:sulfatase-like hydrolase/transferase [Sphaerisporangium sp. TRM90804]MDH2425299.1 sulfatase-like hydrolase/transferase [Sphaerisporangium sp. TRM90804]
MDLDSPSRRALLAAGGGLLTSAVLGGSGRAEAGGATGRPNFVIVLADDLGWGEVGCYGQKLIATPNVDRLAAQGMRFTSAYAGGPLCAPSRASLLTGLHAGHSSVRENPEGGPQRSLSARDVTFGSLLRLAGYRTALFGKWGFGPEAPFQPSHPNARGFDEFLGYITHKHAHQYWPAYLWHNQTTVALNRAHYAPDLFLDHAKRFIRDSAGSGRPFLLYLPTTLPHSPSDVPGHAGRYANKPWSRANRGHAAQVTRLDHHVGQIVRTLREAGVADSTVLLFTGDNGPHREKGVTPRLFDSNGPYRADKRDVYEGGIRVPMVAWSPSLIGPGQVLDDPVTFWDLLPTLADLAGVPVPDHLDGRSMRGLLDGSGGYEGHEYLLWNRPRKVQAIRQGDWKAVRFAPGIAGAGPRGRFELYDLGEDEGESTDLAAARPEVAARLDALIDASIGPNPTLPYGMLVSGEPDASAGRQHRVVVTLHNGSAVSWDDLRVDLETPAGRRVSGGRHPSALPPATSVKVVFTVTPAEAGTAAKPLTSTARFTADGRKVRFRARQAGL